MRWSDLLLLSSDQHTIKLLLAVGAGVSEGEFTNRAQVFNSLTGNVMSEEAQDIEAQEDAQNDEQVEEQVEESKPKYEFETEDAGTLKKKITVTIPVERIDAKRSEMFGEMNKLLQTEFLGGRIANEELKAGIQHIVKTHSRHVG